ncbi:MAG: TIGR03016 family PEP-CTERM system-associated outer membrane protein [Methyloprofundus sp.]|nr:TIGR03016 family PEP-CTERM system-associated outer membrane protein [Methyloprofundus sp.]
MGMGSMVLSIKSQFVRKYKLIPLMGAAYTFFCSTTVFAIDFQYVPSLTIRETYSDNIRLAPKGQEQGAFVTEITPGISIRGVNGGRLTADFSYQMQNLFNAGGDGTAQIFHQMQFNSGYQLMRRSLFASARSSYSQQNVSNLRDGDNINNLEERTNIWTAGTSVNWAPRFGNFANAQVSVDFDYVANDNADQLSNSMNLRESVNIRSGLDFKRITWVAAFNNSTEFRENEDNVHFQNTQATIRAWLDRRFNFFTTLGYANNSFQGSDTSNNGFFYTLGAQWKPNWWFDIEAGYGNNWHVTSNLSLSQRTHLSAGYFDRSVGLNTGGAWSASANHITSRSSWDFTYTEDTTTVQDILLQDSNVPIIDASGNQVLGNDGQPIVFNESLPSLMNDVLVRKTANASVSYREGRSNYQLGGFYERREFENSDNDRETVYGVDVSWNWQFLRRMSFFLSPSWQHIQRNNTNITDTSDENQDRYQLITRLTRTVPFNIGRSRLLNTSLEYRFLKQNSNLLFNSYVENRVTLSLFMNF